VRNFSTYADSQALILGWHYSWFGSFLSNRKWSKWKETRENKSNLENLLQLIFRSSNMIICVVVGNFEMIWSRRRHWPGWFTGKISSFSVTTEKNRLAPFWWWKN